MADEHARPPDAEPLDLNGVAVAPPLTLPQATSLDAESLLADSAPALLSAWDRLDESWERLIDRAAALPAGTVDEKVNDEWSLVETLRHLVFVVDAWVGHGVLGASGYDRLGVPPHFVPNGRELGLDLDATPSLDEVRAVRRRKWTSSGTRSERATPTGSGSTVTIASRPSLCSARSRSSCSRSGHTSSSPSATSPR